MYADLKQLSGHAGSPQLSHYHRTIFPKRSGGVRLIEAPKTLLKQPQRQILDEIFSCVAPHDAAHGFVRGRSIQTFVRPHIGQPAVLKMDLEDYFPSFGAARIEALFRTLGYPESVARLLAGICTTSTPRSAWRNTNASWESIGLHARRHLPQGAPTSPSLASLCTYRLDCRLTGLAAAFRIGYTRYADDLAFSGRVDGISTLAAAIASDEGFRVNHRKTRLMRQGVRQHLSGLVVNRHPNIDRTDYDILKATLTNCVRHGPHTQNHAGHPAFRAHLEGRVAFVVSVNSGRGKKLRDLFERIDWNIIPGKP